MTDKILIDCAMVEQALEALSTAHQMGNATQWANEGLAINALRTALERPVEQESMRVFFPRHTPQHCEDWAIDPAFLSRVLHSIDPDTPCEFTPSPEQIESTLLALEVIPASIYTYSQNLNCKSTQHRLATLWGYEKPQPPRQPLTDQVIQELADEGVFHANVFEIVRRIEEEHGIFKLRFNNIGEQQ